MSFVSGLVECEFVEYLAQRLGLSSDQQPQANEWSRVGNTIGALTLRLGLMTQDQVDRVLEVQDIHGGYFGEIAVNEGYLTSDQVDDLLEIQQTHDQLQLGEQLVVSGHLDVVSLMQFMSDFQNLHSLGHELAIDPI